MHEMTLAQSIVDIVAEQARAQASRRVSKVRLRIGVLSHVDPRALEFGFEVVARGTAAEGAALVIDRPDGSAWCTECSEPIVVTSRADACPRCGGHQWLLTGGDEMRVVDMEVQ